MRGVGGKRGLMRCHIKLKEAVSKVNETAFFFFGNRTFGPLDHWADGFSVFKVGLCTK